MPSGIFTPWKDSPVPDEDGRGSDMSGPGELLPGGTASQVKLSAFDEAVCPKTSGGDATPGRMKTSQFANTPDHGDPHIQTSVAENLTGKAKAK